MGKADPPTLDPAILQRNLSALERTDPPLAERLRETLETDASKPVPAKTRDGQVSFRITGHDGSEEWFGRSSIPGVRGEALLERFDAGQANVLLPGVGEGTEARLLTQRLGRHRAVFVWEEDLANVCLILQLRDVADAIAEGRLVFIPCPLEELAKTLLVWLEAHAGHLCPERIMMWPWQTPAQIAPCRTAVEVAYQQVEQKRQQALAEMRARASTATPASGRIPVKPTVALVALHANDEIWTLTDALSTAAAGLGWSAIPIDVRTPGDMHALARLERLREASAGPPDLAILTDIVRDQVRDVLPDDVRAISWLSRKITIDARLATRAGDDPIAVTDNRLAEQARACGVDARRLTVCPLPCISSLDAETIDLDADRPIDVALFPDSAPVDPTRFGPQLPSYAQIWRVAADLLAARIESFTDDHTESLLTRAEAKANVRIDDPEAREEMIRVLSTCVAPSLLWQFIIQVLLDGKVNLRVFSEAWGESLGPLAGDSAATIAQRVRIMSQTKIVVHVDVAGQVGPVPLLAAGTGAAFLARTHPRDTENGGLHTLLAPGRELTTFSSARELCDTLRRLLADESARRSLADPAYHRCRADHTPARRLATLRAAATSYSDDSGA